MFIEYFDHEQYKNNFFFNYRLSIIGIYIIRPIVTYYLKFIYLYNDSPHPSVSNLHQLHQYLIN